MTETDTTNRIVLPGSEANNKAARQGLSIPHIAARFFDTPLLIQPDKVNALAWAMRDKMGLSLEQPDGAVMDAVGPGLAGERMDPRTGYYIDRGVAVIPIRGTLVNRGAWIGTYSGLMSYEGIAHQLDMVARDDRVSAIMFDVHSYGGEATGVDDLGRMIRALEKPAYAMIDGAGSSAAYWISAASRRVHITRSSHGGSIGVVITHASLQGALEDAGINVTHIHAGTEKVLGSPYRDLSESDREKLQAKVDKTYRAFVEGIAEFRGMTTEAVRATEAAVFDGPELVEQGLADGVTTGRRLLAAIQDNFEDPDPDRDPAFPSGPGRANAQQGGNSMSAATATGGAGQAANESTYTQAEVDELLAEATSGNERLAADNFAEGEKAGAERVLTILGCDAAKTRPALAHKLAAKGYSAEDATEILEASAQETQGSADPLAAAMAGKSPGISSDDGGAAESEADETEAAATFILNAGRAGSSN